MWKWRTVNQWSLGASDYEGAAGESEWGDGTAWCLNCGVDLIALNVGQIAQNYTHTCKHMYW